MKRYLVFEGSGCIPHRLGRVLMTQAEAFQTARERAVNGSVASVFEEKTIFKPAEPVQEEAS